jgi:hypothetical protein
MIDPEYALRAVNPEIEPADDQERREVAPSARVTPCGYCGHSGAHAEVMSAAGGRPRSRDCPICQMEMAEERIKEDALTRLREATAKEMAVFADKLRKDARKAAATEEEIRTAENTQPRHEP